MDVRVDEDPAHKDGNTSTLVNPPSGIKLDFKLLA